MIDQSPKRTTVSDVRNVRNVRTHDNGWDPRDKDMCIPKAHLRALIFMSLKFNFYLLLFSLLFSFSSFRLLKSLVNYMFF